jgi:hypothetical protein
MTDGLEQRAGAADGADRVVARWRVESIGAIRRTLEAIVADEEPSLRATEPTRG